MDEKSAPQSPGTPKDKIATPTCNSDQDPEPVPDILDSTKAQKDSIQEDGEKDQSSIDCSIPKTCQDNASSNDSTPISAPTTQLWGSDLEIDGMIEQSSETTLDSPSAQSSRAPSPWQDAINSLPSEERRVMDHLSRSIAWVLRSSQSLESDVEMSPQPDTTASDDASTLDDPGTDLLRSRSDCADDSETQSPNQNQASNNQRTTSSSTGQSLRRSRDSVEGDGNDGTGSSLPFKRQKTTQNGSFKNMKRLRYACPYNKWDPRGCPLCCMPSNKNPEGGAETFSRVKSHTFRNHDISVRCQRCWGSFPSKTETLAQHSQRNDCMVKASPTKYWMTEEQRQQVRGQRFTGSSDENWYHLFRLLLPDVLLNDEDGNYILSPYYVPLNECRMPSISSGQTYQETTRDTQELLLASPTPNLQISNQSFIDNLPPNPLSSGQPAIPNNAWSDSLSDFMLAANTSLTEQLNSMPGSNGDTTTQSSFFRQNEPWPVFENPSTT